MGLDILGVSSDYMHEYTDNDDEIEIGETYGSTYISYSGYSTFRDALIRYCTDGHISSIGSNYFGMPLACCFYDDKTYAVAFNPECFTQEEIMNNQEVSNYVLKLKCLQKDYPKLYNIYDFVCHSDCEGEVPVDTCERLLPILTEFIDTFEECKEKFNYAEWVVDFAKRLSNVLTEIVPVGGKLLYS